MTTFKISETIVKLPESDVFKEKKTVKKLNLKKVKIEESHSGLKIEDVEWVEIAPAGTRPTSGVVTPSKSEME